jgi:heme/copper-type cytochrome/quinol oxidase subunit 4
MENSFKLVAIGFVLLIIGSVLPFLMVIDLVESTLFLNFLAVTSSIAGLTVGFLGITQLRSRR